MKAAPGPVRLTLLVLLLTMLPVSCAPAQERAVFVPPAATSAPGGRVLPSPSPTPAAPRETPTPVPTTLPACANGLRYIEDLTIPDGSEAAPGAALDKRWRVENNGACNWDAGYRLKLIAGPALGAAEEQALYPARAGTVAEIRIVFTAPAEAGVYRSAWQAFSPEGVAFGDPIFIEVVVR